MMPLVLTNQAPVPPPAYHRMQGRLGSNIHIDALTLVTTLHLLTLCPLAVRVAHRRCPPPLPAGPGGAPRTYSEASLLLIALLRTLWRLSYQDMRDWLRDWPALALACGLPLDAHGTPRIPSVSQQWKRGHRAGAPVTEALFAPFGANRHPSSAHRGARSDHRQCAHSVLAPHRSRCCCRSLLPDSFVDSGWQVDLLVLLLSLFLDD